jgi:hypothetical protein
MKIPAPTLDAFSQRFPRGVPARLVQVIRAAVEEHTGNGRDSQHAGNEEAELRFCVHHDLVQEQEMFLRRLAEAGFRIPWSRVVVSNHLPEKNVLPAILFGGVQNQVVGINVLQTYSIDDLMRDVKMKKAFWELAKVTFKEIIPS